MTTHHLKHHLKTAAAETTCELTVTAATAASSVWTDVNCPACQQARQDAADEHKVCPYCGKRKRGWRTQHAEMLCAECERKVRQ